MLNKTDTIEERVKTIVCIPAFNESKFVGDTVRESKSFVDEVVVVDDGSNDDTAGIATLAGASVIRHDKNRGYGAAIKTCFAAAKETSADILVIIDGDGQHNPGEIPKLLAPVLRGEADLVIGSRLLTGENKVPAYRKFGINVITLLWNFGSKVKVCDSQSGFRAYSKKMFNNFLPSETGMSISIETLEGARNRGLVIKEVPISCLYPHSVINLNAITHGLGVALSVFKIRLKYYLHNLFRSNNRGNYTAEVG